MSLTYDDVIAKYEPVLGLEVHVDLPSLFSSSRCVANG
jgi:hypothetical protein